MKNAGMRIFSVKSRETLARPSVHLRLCKTFGRSQIVGEADLGLVQPALRRMPLKLAANNHDGRRGIGEKVVGERTKQYTMVVC